MTASRFVSDMSEHARQQEQTTACGQSAEATSVGAERWKASEDALAQSSERRRQSSGFIRGRTPQHSVFQHFLGGLEDITFLPVEGTAVSGERTIKAIVKAKMGLKRASQLRRTSSDLTVHCFPEDFDDVTNIQDVIGSAIRWKGRNYSLDGATVGKNYETGEIEHITFNCSLAIYTDDRPKFALEKDRNIIFTTETGRIFMVEQYAMEGVGNVSE